MSKTTLDWGKAPSMMSPSKRAADDTPVYRLRTAQRAVYAAAQNPHGLRCGDLVDVEWEGEYYPGVVTDVPKTDELAVAYTNGDFEESVPQQVARLRSIPPKRKPAVTKGRKGEKEKVNLAYAANQGDIGLVMQALRSGADPKGYDESGFSPLHWAAAPDEGMPGDTIARRACIAILARLGDVDAPDQTALGLRAVQWCVTKNYVGCIKTFAHVNADLSGTIHWAVSNKAHACVRELMRLGVAAKCHKDLWDGMTPLMLAANQNDTYGMQLMMDRAEATRGPEAVARLVNGAHAQGSRFRQSALHYAADSAADLCTTLLLKRGARCEVRNSKGETPLVVAKKRAAAAAQGDASEGIVEAANKCVEILEEAIAKEKALRRASHESTGLHLAVPQLSSGSGTGKRKAKGTGKAAQAAAAAAAAIQSAGGGESSTGYDEPSPRAYDSTAGGESPRAYDSSVGYMTGDLTGGETGGEMTCDDEYDVVDGGSVVPSPRARGDDEGGGAEYDDEEGGGGGGELDDEEDGQDYFWERPIGEIISLDAQLALDAARLAPNDWRDNALARLANEVAAAADAAEEPQQQLESAGGEEAAEEDAVMEEQEDDLLPKAEPAEPADPPTPHNVDYY